MNHNVDRSTRISNMLNKELERAITRREVITVRAKMRAHRRLNKYAKIVRTYHLPWEKSRHLIAWRMVREAADLVRRLESPKSTTHSRQNSDVIPHGAGLRRNTVVSISYHGSHT